MSAVCCKHTFRSTFVRAASIGPTFGSGSEMIACHLPNPCLQQKIEGLSSWVRLTDCVTGHRKAWCERCTQDCDTQWTAMPIAQWRQEQDAAIGTAWVAKLCHSRYPAFQVWEFATCEVQPHFAMPIFRAFSSAGVQRWLGRSRGGGTGSGGIRRHAQQLRCPAAPPCRAGGAPSCGGGGWSPLCYSAAPAVSASRGLGWHAFDLRGASETALKPFS